MMHDYLKYAYHLIYKNRLDNLFVLFLCSLVFIQPAHAERLKDLATIQGVRNNQLMGYGLVVGLDGTGDQTPYTVQSMISMMQQMGINLPAGTSVQMKNVASVIITSSLPAFAQPGQTLDVTVSSMGSAKSLRGGTLLMTPLKGADGQIYAMAQGNLVVGGVGASANGSQTQINHLSVGRISDGATVERAIPNTLSQTDNVNLELKESDFSTATLVVDAINRRFGQNTAFAQDGRVIRVQPPANSSRVSFLAALETINVAPAATTAKIILNARTGSVVMNQAVTLENCAVSHGNLSVVINTDPVISQPGALSSGQTVSTARSQIEINKEPGKVLKLNSGANLSDVVKALNAIGATPQDLLAILQAMKAAGSLRADLEVI
ncbi:flagellar basal body P-ring protein FlgI [Methylotenera sp.]|jgi:flagellar P-ring protein precursor FlgI|uniref:flagellar basal body P-ring protein FlgI n=1 Tax=Methylotenera sp. TaxID=2051956 RepID=UPI00273172AF|nr:flagellar basal body P-ring protein FlgI [Methylotenera sp.]MDP2229570.1 flagellar basal body P-ring protein FlgI [Methylotenera sp.]MDP3140122.1 flagellar basal body P-ring protein FlgI [Methylotenera sp.]